MKIKMPSHLSLKIDRFREQLIVESTRLGDDNPFRSVTYPRAYIVDLYDWILQVFPSVALVSVIFQDSDGMIGCQPPNTALRISGELPENHQVIPQIPGDRVALCPECGIHHPRLHESGPEQEPPENEEMPMESDVTGLDVDPIEFGQK